MSDFEKEYQRIIDELENEIVNNKDLEIAKEKLYDIYKYIVKNDRSINELIENQAKMKSDIDRLKKAVSNIEEDIYEDFEEDSYDDEFDTPYKEDKMHDNDYEFEITCPYCNYDFIADNSYINKVQIPCPKCKRIIDLDWSSAEEYYDDSELDSESRDIRYSASDKDTANNVTNNAVKEKPEQFRYNDDLKNRELKVQKAKSKKDTNKNKGKSQDNSKNESDKNNESNENNENNENNEDDM